MRRISLNNLNAVAANNGKVEAVRRITRHADRTVVVRRPHLLCGRVGGSAMRSRAFADLLKTPFSDHSYYLLFCKPLLGGQGPLFHDMAPNDVKSGTVLLPFLPDLRCCMLWAKETCIPAFLRTIYYDQELANMTLDITDVD